eukprot:2818097-Amphidinium_carterae.1
MSGLLDCSVIPRNEYRTDPLSTVADVCLGCYSNEDCCLPPHAVLVQVFELLVTVKNMVLKLGKLIWQWCVRMVSFVHVWDLFWSLRDLLLLPTSRWGIIRVSYLM